MGWRKEWGRVVSYVVPPDDIELRLTRQTEGGSFPSTESLRLQIINLHWPVHGHDYNVIHATQPETQRILCEIKYQIEINNESLQRKRTCMLQGYRHHPHRCHGARSHPPECVHCSASVYCGKPSHNDCTQLDRLHSPTCSHWSRPRTWGGAPGGSSPNANPLHSSSCAFRNLQPERTAWIRRL